MGKNEKTSQKVATIASELLRNPKNPKDVKTVAAFALTQAADKKKARKRARSNIANAGLWNYHNPIGLLWCMLGLISKIVSQ